MAKKTYKRPKKNQTNGEEESDTSEVTNNGESDGVPSEASPPPAYSLLKDTFRNAFRPLGGFESNASERMKLMNSLMTDDRMLPSLAPPTINSFAASSKKGIVPVPPTPNDQQNDPTKRTYGGFNQTEDSVKDLTLPHDVQKIKYEFESFKVSVEASATSILRLLDTDKNAAVEVIGGVDNQVISVAKNLLSLAKEKRDTAGDEGSATGAIVSLNNQPIDFDKIEAKQRQINDYYFIDCRKEDGKTEVLTDEYISDLSPKFDPELYDWQQSGLNVRPPPLNKGAPFYLGGSGVCAQYTTYGGTPYPMVDEEFYEKHIIGKEIGWVNGTKLLFSCSRREDAPEQRTKADWQCCIPRAPIQAIRQRYSLYKFSTGECFWEGFHITGMGKVPAIIGGIPFYITALICKDIFGPQYPPQGLQSTIKLVLNGRYQRILQNYMVIPRALGYRDSVLTMPTAKPAMTLNYDEETNKWSTDITCNWRTSAKGVTGLGMNYAPNSAFNVAAKCGEYIGHPLEVIDILVMSQYVMEEISNKVKMNGFFLVLNEIRLHVDSDYIFKSFAVGGHPDDPEYKTKSLESTGEREHLHKMSGEQIKLILDGWILLKKTVEELWTEYSIALSVHKTATNIMDARVLAGVAIINDFYLTRPGCNGKGKQIPIEDDIDGIAAADVCAVAAKYGQVCPPTYRVRQADWLREGCPFDRLSIKPMMTDKLNMKDEW